MAPTLSSSSRKPPTASGDVLMLLLDFCVPNLSGIGLLRVLRRFARVPPTILVTGFPDPSVETLARSAGAVCVLRKPLKAQAVCDAVAAAAARTAEDHLPPVVGRRSASTLQVRCEATRCPRSADGSSSAALGAIAAASSLVRRVVRHAERDPTDREAVAISAAPVQKRVVERQRGTSGTIYGVPRVRQERDAAARWWQEARPQEKLSVVDVKTSKKS